MTEQNTKRKRVTYSDVCMEELKQMIEPNTKRKCYVCDSNKIIKVFTNFKNKNKHYYCKDCADKYIIHKPDKLKETVSRNGRCNATSFLGEKQLMVCKTCRKLSFDLKEKNSKDLVAELRSKCGRYALTHEAKASLNPYINMNEYDEMNVKCKLHTWNEGWDACCDELERLLKVKK